MISDYSNHTHCAIPRRVNFERVIVSCAINDVEGVVAYCITRNIPRLDPSSNIFWFKLLWQVKAVADTSDFAIGPRKLMRRSYNVANIVRITVRTIQRNRSHSLLTH